MTFVHVIVVVIVSTFLVATVDSQSVREPANFNVIPLSYLRSAFVRARGTNYNASYPTSEEFFEAKADICMAIVRSQWMYTMHHLNVVNLLEKDIYEELKQDYPSLFAASYTEYDPVTKNVTFANHYKLRCVTVDEGGNKFQLEVYTFSCLARNRRTGKVVEYFVSPEYPPSDVRFVFQYNDRKEFVPIAQASPVGCNINFFEKAANGSERLFDLFVKDTNRVQNESEERRQNLFKSIPHPNSVLFGASTWRRRSKKR